jgi:hypothetical protein
VEGVLTLERNDEVSVNREQGHITTRRVIKIELNFAGIELLVVTSEDDEIMPVNMDWVSHRCLGLIDLTRGIVEGILELAFDEEIHPTAVLVIQIYGLVSFGELGFFPALIGSNLDQAQTRFGPVQVEG